MKIKEKKNTIKVIYSSNNSGGSWWLKDDDWYNLEKAGWKVDWYKNNDPEKYSPAGTDGRFLGALASVARRHGLSLEDAIDEWKNIVNKDPTAKGCSCCGWPHNFYTE